MENDRCFNRVQRCRQQVDRALRVEFGNEFLKPTDVASEDALLLYRIRQAMISVYFAGVADGRRNG